MKKDRKLRWQQALSILAIGFGTAGAMDSAIATPIREQNSFKLAQVGVRSRINAPTPLNIRPRTHIPLPASRYNRHHDYYGGSYYGNYNRGHRNHRRYRDYDRYDRYGYGDRYEHRHHRRRNHRRGAKITIFF